MKRKKSEIRQRNIRRTIRFTEEEIQIIEKNAADCGLALAPFLRNVGAGYTVQGVLDQKAVLNLLKVSGDLGRLGGLLKLWLSQRETHLPPEAGVGVDELKGLYGKIAKSQEQIEAIAEKL